MYEGLSAIPPYQVPTRDIAESSDADQLTHPETGPAKPNIA
jgi:hypothetical protein